MYNFIFDLDDTLYQYRYLKRPFDYKLGILCNKFKRERNPKKRSKLFKEIYNCYLGIFNKDLLLDKMLRKINYPKHIITNSQNIHCFTALNVLGIRDNFRVILTAQTQSKMKPYKLVYDKFEKLKGNNFRNIFFDDRLENLYYPHERQWITVLINPDIYMKLKKIRFINQNMLILFFLLFIRD